MNPPVAPLLFDLLEKAQIASKSICKEESWGEPNLSSLAGFCARGSLILYKLLEENGIPSHFVKDEYKYVFPCGHVYLVSNDLLLDPTATQFGGDSKFIRPLKEGQKELRDLVIMGFQHQIILDKSFVIKTPAGLQRHTYNWNSIQKVKLWKDWEKAKKILSL